jgi:DNA-binding beta-propeller fold protein YncE
VLPDGTTTILTEDPILNRPHGVAVDDDENVYVASAHDGNVYKLVEQEDGTATVTPFAFVDGLQMQWACGFMAFLDDALYITNGDNKVHRISLAGEVTDYAGTGAAGALDGPASQATFFAPNGIAAAPDGRIFVAEYAQMRVRVITPVATGANLPGPTGSAGVRLLPNHPNPFAHDTMIAFELARSETVRLAVYDAGGRMVRTLVRGTEGPGRHEARWDGRTDAGGTAAPGVYFYRLEAAGEARSARMTRVR